MFPSAFRRLADAALEVADALLAPEAFEPTAADPAEPASAAAVRNDPTGLDARPHRRSLPSAERRTSAAARRRAGAIASTPQPCLSPLPHQLAARSDNATSPSRLQRLGL